MLAGAPPFTGPSAQVVLDRHATEPAPPLAGGVAPPQVGAAIRRALSKSPEHRFATAGEFVAALGPESGPAIASPLAHGLRRVAPIAALAGVVAVALAVAVARGRAHVPAASESSAGASVVAVLPFRVSASPPELSGLKHDIANRLATRLTGDGSPRAADPQATLAAWRRVAGDDGNDLAPDAGTRSRSRSGSRQGDGRFGGGGPGAPHDHGIPPRHRRRAPGGPVRRRRSTRQPSGTARPAGRATPRPWRRPGLRPAHPRDLGIAARASGLSRGPRGVSSRPDERVARLVPAGHRTGLQLRAGGVRSVPRAARRRRRATSQAAGAGRTRRSCRRRPGAARHPDRPARDRPRADRSVAGSHRRAPGGSRSVVRSRRRILSQWALRRRYRPVPVRGRSDAARLGDRFRSGQRRRPGAAVSIRGRSPPPSGGAGPDGGGHRGGPPDGGGRTGGGLDREGGLVPALATSRRPG